MTHVHVVDDHWMVRRGLREVLEASASVTQVTESENLHDAFDACRDLRRPVDVVILDLVLRAESGIAAIPQIKAITPTIGVLAISFLAEDPHGVHAIVQGADGYVTKGVGPKEVIDAVGHVASGRKYVSAGLAELLARRVQRSGDLTAREWEILRCYSLGLGCVEIASRLSLSPKTVSTHKSNGMRKLGLRSTADLVRWAMEHGLP
ncbi:MAG: response regulator transcription factor [Acidobacteria bacterium]|nr:response regulator transcription factor [Acidobacteriota bacterium]